MYPDRAGLTRTRAAGFGVFVAAITWAAVCAAREAVLVPGKTTAGDPGVRGWVRAALAREAGLDVLSRDDAAARLRAAAPATPHHDADVEALLAGETRDLLESVAYGRDGETIERGRGIIARERPRLALTGRSDRAAAALGDVCFFVVRALLHQDDEPDAREQMEDCMRTVPDAVPAEARHPQSVRALFERARATPTATLVVSTGSKSPGACSLRVQGRRLGAVPDVVQLLPGSYTVDADCGRPGRLHTVTLVAGNTTRLRVAPNLERALGEEPALGQVDVDHFEESELAMLLDWLSVDELWTVDSTSRSVHIGRSWREGQRIAQRSADVDAAPAETLHSRLDAAVARLTCSSSPCPVAARAENERYAPSPVALAAASLAAASVIGSFVAWARYDDLDGAARGLSPADARYASTIAERDQFGAVALATGLVGASGLAATTPFLLPSERHVPWWAWATGAGGTALGGVGIALWLGNGRLESPTRCGNDTCWSRTSTVPLGPMLVADGASLLAVPVTYLVRSATHSDDVTTGVVGTPGGAVVTCSYRSALF